MKTNLSNFTEEELLKALEVADKKETRVIDFNGFIHTFNLKPGTNKITPAALYSLYKKWSRTPISRSEFSSNINLIFERTPKGRVLINLEPLAVLQLIGENVKKPRKIKNSPTAKKHFEIFLKKFEMEKGSLFIKFSVLYDAYDKWQYSNKLKTRLSKMIFSEFMDLYFKRKKDNNESYFGLDPKILNNLTHDQKLQCLSQKSKLNAIKKENQAKSN